MDPHHLNHNHPSQPDSIQYQKWCSSSTKLLANIIDPKESAIDNIQNPVEESSVIKKEQALRENNKAEMATPIPR